MSSRTIAVQQPRAANVTARYGGLARAWPLLALATLAAAIRFVTLGQQSLWYDEAVTALRILHPSLTATLSAVAHIENTPPLYYIVAWLWTRVFGTGVFGLRSLSAVAGVATVPVAWAIGRELRSRATAVVLAAIVATNPLFVWYSQEARAYELFVLLAAIAFLFFLRARSAPTTANLAGWAIASALALLTHYFAIFLIASEAVFLLAVRPRSRVLLALAPVALVAAALVPLVVAQGGHGTGWIDNWPLVDRAHAIGYYYLLGESGRPLGRLAEWATLLPLLATLLLAWRADRRTLAPVLLCVAVGVAAIVAPLLLALAGVDYLAPRYLVAAWVPLSAALALLLTSRWELTGALLALVICAGALVVDAAVVTRPQLQRGAWNWAADQLRRGPSDRAVVISALGALPLRYYLPALQQFGPGVAVRVREIDLVGYAPLRRAARRPPAAGFVRGPEANNHGLIVLRFRAVQPRLVAGRRLLAARPVNVPTEALAPYASWRSAAPTRR
jgi:4-amino-4-deoxy-L-arabinose transferase-like glycosyltransferase